MNVRLMYPDADFVPDSVSIERKDPIVHDLELGTLVRAMAGSDVSLAKIAATALLAPLRSVSQIRYRQAVLKDCAGNVQTIKALYELAVSTLDTERHTLLLGTFGRSPGSTLYRALQLAGILDASLRRLRLLAEQRSEDFVSDGFRAFFGSVIGELTDEFFSEFQQHRRRLQFPQGVLLSAQLGRANQGIDYMLRRAIRPERPWILRALGPSEAAYSFTIDERDEAGSRALATLTDRGISTVANALAYSMEHVLAFFGSLKDELGYYIGCLNLRTALTALGQPTCIPEALESSSGFRHAQQLYDPSLALSGPETTVGNDLAADGARFVIITGANRGGKSTFLRSVGLAQLMMQSGMFVAAAAFRAEVCDRILTHFKREEDLSMTSGKLDEELARMSSLVDAVVPGSLVLLNESFASTNEREGSDIASQVVAALVDRGVTVFYVTHLYEFARAAHEQHSPDVLFLLAERAADGTRTFKVSPGFPKPTSYALDLYRRILG